MARGYLATQKYNAENTGMGYTPFTIKKDGEKRQVRILQHELEWVNLHMHSAWKIVKPTRCAAPRTMEDDVEVEDRSQCPLCNAECPRSPKVCIPVRVRGDEDASRVQIIMYGRDHFAMVADAIEHLPEGKSMTDYDFEIKRVGSDTNTKYFWYRTETEQRPLNEAELKLEVPDMEEIVPILEEHVLLRRAKDYLDSEDAAPVGAAGGGGSNGSAKTPF